MIPSELYTIVVRMRGGDDVTVEFDDYLEWSATLSALFDNPERPLWWMLPKNEETGRTVYVWTADIVAVIVEGTAPDDWGQDD